MAETLLKRDLYDLNYSRALPVGKEEDEDITAETAASLEMNRIACKKRRKKLNQDSIALRIRLERKDAFLLCLHYLACALEPDQTLDISQFAKLPIQSPRPDAENEEVKIRARQETVEQDLNFQEKILAQSLKCLSKLLIQSRSHLSWHEEPRVLYRLHHKDSYTFYYGAIGFCGYRWLRQRQFAEPSPQDFKDHVTGRHFDSPYISLTESPFRVLRLARPLGIDKYSVFVIDAVRLRATKIPIERTTALKKKFGVGKLDYVTETHWLAQYWVPADCIVKTLGKKDFLKICGDEGICDRNDKKDEANLVKRRVDINTLLKYETCYSRRHVGFAEGQDLADAIGEVSLDTSGPTRQ